MQAGINQSRMSSISIATAYVILIAKQAEQANVLKNLKAKREEKIEFTKRLKPDHKSPAYTRNVYC